MYDLASGGSVSGKECSTANGRESAEATAAKKFLQWGWSEGPNVLIAASLQLRHLPKTDEESPLVRMHLKISRETGGRGYGNEWSSHAVLQEYQNETPDALPHVRWRERDLNAACSILYLFKIHTLIHFPASKPGQCAGKNCINRHGEVYETGELIQEIRYIFPD